MRLKHLIYSELEQWLFHLGFTALITSGEQKVFQHPRTDTLIVLPKYESQEPVHPIHLTAVRRILLENGLVSEDIFSNFLEKVPS
jgi:hypothetical protein